MADSSRGWIVDSHVHLHDGFDLRRFLAAAARNLRRGADVVGAREGSAGCLILTDTSRQQGFARLCNGRLADWTPEDTGETSSLVLRHHLPVAVVSGRQVATLERLEVLAFPAPRELPDGEPLAQTIERARAAGATILLPWAFGKWWFARGRRVERLLDVEGTSLLVGDNGNRPRWLPTPRLLRRARVRGMAHQPNSFCRSEPLLRFVLSQAMMQLPRAFRRRWEGSAGK